MYSPVNKFKDKNLNSFNLINIKTSSKKGIKYDINNSINGKKLILSRNNFNNKNFLVKTKNNNSYKKIILNGQLSSDNTSPNHKQNNTTTNIIKTNIKNIDSKGQILNYKKIDKDYNNITLYKYLLSKINDNNNLYNKFNFNNNKLDFNMNILINNHINNDENDFTGIKNNKNININNINENYYKKILNIPLSPINKNIKKIKLNNIDINEIPGLYKHISSSNNEKIINLNKNNNIINNNFNKNQINNHIKIDNSFIYHNTNNINLNVNIINKKIINDKSHQNNISTGKNIFRDKDLIYNSSTNDTKEQNKVIHNHDEGANLIYNYSLGNLTNNKKKAIKIKPIKYNFNKNEIINLSSDNSSINQKEKIFAEEIHFKAVKYIQEIKNNEKTFDYT